MTTINSSRPSTVVSNATDLILASTSRHRRTLLERLGVPFRCLPPRVDEGALKASSGPDERPGALAERLARAKADSLADVEPEAIVIGGDQLVEFQGRIFGKPAGAEGAIEQLATMAGRPHRLITALAVRHRERMVVHVDVTTLYMRPLSRAEIGRYVAADLPLDCAGGYKLEERGIALFDRIESDDQTAITGLPLIALTTILRGLGMSIP
jgi:septum formation protein